jgi:hypothetical protein
LSIQNDEEESIKGYGEEHSSQKERHKFEWGLKSQMDFILRPRSITPMLCDLNKLKIHSESNRDSNSPLGKLLEGFEVMNLVYLDPCQV